ncbi:MAG: hypothetical protein ACR2QS_06235 [Woeseiaceae bacterium]
MKHRHSEGRFLDLSNPPKPRWRDALARLAAPALRMHRYRILNSAAIDDIIGDLDCEKQS